MPYAIIQREYPSVDIVIKAATPEFTYCLALGTVELGTKTVTEWRPDTYENQNGSFKVCDGVYIKSDVTNLSVYNKRGLAIWLDEKTAKERLTPKFELKYFTERALASHYLLGANLYNCIKQSILNELEELEEHSDKIEWLIGVINERYYNKNGSDEYGRYNKAMDEVKPPYNFFENF